MSNYRRVFIDNHYYFITSVIKDRSLSMLTDNVSVFKNALQLSKNKYDYKIHAIVILPDHFHIIIRPDIINEYPQIISCIKREFSKRLNPDLKKYLAKNLSPSQIKHRESGAWQRRYFERTIRDQNDLNHLTDYIHFNPVKHGYVKSIKDWKYSSFMKFVKNNHYDEDWCDFTENSNYD